MYVNYMFCLITTYQAVHHFHLVIDVPLKIKYTFEILSYLIYSCVMYIEIDTKKNIHVCKTFSNITNMHSTNYRNI